MTIFGSNFGSTLGARQNRALALLTAVLIGSTLVAGTNSAIAASKKTPAAVAGGACTTLGQSTKIGAKSYNCARNLGGKMVWMLASLAGGTNAGSKTGTGAKPSIAGGNGPHPADEGSSADAARHKAMAAYQACLTQHGLTGGFGFGFGGPGRGPDDQQGAPNGQNGAPNPMPSAGASRRPFTQPSLTAAQQQALTACASLRPQFGGGFGGGPRPGDGPRPGASLALGGTGSATPTTSATSTPSSN